MACACCCPCNCDALSYSGTTVTLTSSSACDTYLCQESGETISDTYEFSGKYGCSYEFTGSPNCSFTEGDTVYATVIISVTCDLDSPKWTVSVLAYLDAGTLYGEVPEALCVVDGHLTGIVSVPLYDDTNYLVCTVTLEFA